MKNYAILLVLLVHAIASRPQCIDGLVLSHSKAPLPDVTVVTTADFQVFITDSQGRFRICGVSLTDSVQLRITSMGFEPVTIKVAPAELSKTLSIILKEEATMLEDVVIAAGSFEASDEGKTTVLKPFEIATTPADKPDIFKALQQLPGTSKVGEAEGLFVRGGDASETRAVIDGLAVQDPFFSSIPGVAQNSRFSPLMFKGTSFSTGGYSAQYGQALSSVLLLNTQDVAQSSSGSMIVSTTGASGNITQSWNRNSFSMNGSYLNLRPSFHINEQNFTYQHAPEGGGANLLFRREGKNKELFKIYASYQQTSAALFLPYQNTFGNRIAYALANHNLFINSTYKKSFGKWQGYAGTSFSHNADNLRYDSIPIDKYDQLLQGRIVLSRLYNNGLKVIAGSELQDIHFQNLNEATQQKYSLSNLQLAGFVEGEFYIGHKIAARAGMRYETSLAIHRANYAPRMSVAWVFSSESQISFATGTFYQLPSEVYLFTNRQLQFEKASHYILNYQHIRNNRTFRIEGYFKNYNSLVRDQSGTLYQSFSFNRIPLSGSNNSGYGYARGIDVFWFDKQSIKDFSYWVSYSLLDTRRLFQNYQKEAMPTFAAHHNVSVVAKYTIPSTSLNIGMTYNYTSGRPYYNPNHAFLTDKTPALHNLIVSVTQSWFVKNNLIAVFIYADNVLGIKNVYSYFYSADGQRQYPLTPPAYRSIYAGINITLAKRRSIMGINF